MKLEAEMEQVQRYTWRVRLHELRDALGCYDSTKLEEYLDMVNLVGVDWKV